MLSLFTLAIVLAAFAGCGAAASVAPSSASVTQSPARSATIVAFGDSLTSGHGLPRDQAYSAHLERMLAERGLPYTVVNHGVSGDTTAQALRRLDTALAAKPLILIVALGANDGLRGVPVAQVRANLASIIERAQAQGAAVLLCGMDALPINGWEYTVQFHQLYPALAAKYNVTLVPSMLFALYGKEGLLQADMAHPNAAGAAEIAKTIWPHLEPLLVRSTEAASQL